MPMRSSVFVVASLLFLSCSAGPAQPAPCSPATCAGCCDAAGACQAGGAPSACGSGGATCVECLGFEGCIFGFCSGSSTSGGGGGSAAGGGGGGGGTTGGGGGSLGEEVRLPTFQRVSATERYRDPVDGFDGGWLAGLAPVGQTGLVVVVQTRD